MYADWENMAIKYVGTFILLHQRLRLMIEKVLKMVAYKKKNSNFNIVTMDLYKLRVYGNYRIRSHI